MTAAVRQLLDSFEALPAAERHEAAAEILRRTLHDSPGDVTDESLTLAAEELFQRLDADEARRGES